MKQSSLFVVLMFALILACAGGKDSGDGAGGGGSDGSGSVNAPAAITDQPTIGGAVIGLDGVVILQNNGGYDLSVTADGPYVFDMKPKKGDAYAVTVKYQSQGNYCCVNNGNGAVGDSAVTNVNVYSLRKIYPHDGVANLNFGNSISISGGTVVAGAEWGEGVNSHPGLAYVFVKDGSAWTQEARLAASDGTNANRFGCSVSLDGDTVIVGANCDSAKGTASGAAYVFKRSGTSWTQEAKLVASDGAIGNFFGGSVSLSGDIAIMGAYRNNAKGDSSGAAYVFRRTSSGWTQEAKLVASDGAANDYFGLSVSVNGAIIVVGATGDDDKGSGSGSAYVFTYANKAWTQEAKLTASDGVAGASFGRSVTVSGDTALVGADNMDSWKGAAYAFRRSFNKTTNKYAWRQEAKLVASDGASGNYTGDYLGWSVSLSGNMAVVGSYHCNTRAEASGAAYLFRRYTDKSGNTLKWVQKAKLSASDGAAYDYFGIDVSISGETIAMGSLFNNTRGSKSGAAYILNSTTPSSLGANIRSMLGRRTTLFIAIGAGVLAIGIIGAVAVIRRRRKSA